MALSACGGGGSGPQPSPDAPALAADAAAVEATHNWSLPVPLPAPGAGPSASCATADLPLQALELLNAQRATGAQCGSHAFAAAPPLAWSETLARAAWQHSGDMAAHDFFSHTGSDGSNVSARAAAAGYAASAWGENISAGQPSVGTVVGGWMSSPGHCANIMSAAFREIGLACASGGAGNAYRNYWTLTLAAPR